ncbi:nicotinate-nucleotide--dimethylbenzimidazole phosphoribosyltransferase [Hydrogenophaga sp.]|uniref:nicotinate-nucleotide--dimethylbenzimidazole phosphoribosyltransferase n=1 Tax=Hydrogenophaga sp. TaxID=1904254 RepID=UPI0025C67B1F|nr:nicotinate-nucleotide--dimethylbenzimidazole phosphoribosyltransferase [Hydrogenophaga sp.]
MLIQHHSAEADTPTDVEAPAPKLPAIAATADALLDAAMLKRIQPEAFSPHALGRLEDLVLQLARVQSAGHLPLDLLVFDSPQVLVFAADHGISDEGVSAVPQQATRERVQQILQGRAPINTLAETMGFDLTVVDAGVASHVVEAGAAAPSVPLLVRKIGYGTRNMVLGPAMSLAQAISALQAGMDVVRHLPGNVLALGDVGVGNTSCAALLLSRLCGVPLADACGRDHPIPGGLDNTQLQNKLEKLSAAASRHRKAVKPLDALAALGGFEIAMMAGAMLQAASERRVVLVDGFVAGAAALVARGLCPPVADYLVFTHRTIDPGHRLMLIHLQVQPLMDMELRVGQGVGALVAWPILQTAQALLEH